jgi:ParB family chromosome partitioning protein
MTTALATIEEGGQLILERVRSLLQTANTTDEAKHIRDQVAAMAVYMRARGAAEDDIALALEAKQYAERRIGQLTREMPKAQGKRTDQLSDRPSPSCLPANEVRTKLAALEDKGISKKQASRWEKLAAMPEVEFAELAKARAENAAHRASKEQDKGGTHVAKNTGEVEWYTPPEYIEAARRVMRGIDLDPASCLTANETVKAKRFYSKDNNGLDKDWSGRVWMNPPYAKGEVDAFAEKLAAEVRVKKVSEACVLVNNATDTGWFQTLADVASAVCFTLGRVKFLDRDNRPVGAPLQGQAVIYIGSNSGRFVSEFSILGTCWVRP